jgi:hypothetical protein
VTEPDSVLLDRAQLERAFTALGERLVRRGVVADVFVVGGAAMALAYDTTRVTRDVDSLFVPHGVVLEEARNVAKELGLPAWWLNEQASVYTLGLTDRELPELVITGLPYKRAADVLTRAAWDVLAGETLAPGNRIRMVGACSPRS